MKKRDFVTRFFYPIALALFCIDLWGTFTFNVFFAYTVLCLCAYTLATRPTYLRITYLLTLLSLESWLINGHFGLSLIFLLPIVVVMFKIKPKLYDSRLVIAALAFLMITCQCVLIEGLCLSQFHSPIFTLVQIPVNILLTMSISLI